VNAGTGRSLEAPRGNLRAASNVALPADRYETRRPEQVDEAFDELLKAKVPAGLVFELQLTRGSTRRNGRGARSRTAPPRRARPVAWLEPQRIRSG
jgi:hypothetical protein